VAPVAWFGGDTLVVMAENITEEQLKDYWMAFNAYDKDGNGSISVEELRGVVESLGHTVTDEELRAMIAEVDTDDSGTLDFAEFLALMAFRLMLNDNEDEILEAFRIFDKDGNGKLSAEELEAVLKNLGEKLTEKECAEIIRLADQDGDGQVQYREFVKFLMTS
jgi:Ca2+-binding EF-hand superfamily protein